MFSRWTIESGVSRGTRSRRLPSFNATSAARSTRFELNPIETRAIVPIEHGHRITPPVRDVPEEGGASTASERKTRTRFADAAPSQSAGSAASLSPRSPGSTPSS
jgi:hypothetical protein